MERELYKIYKEYDSDCDKGSKHTYIDFYEGLFLPLRSSELNLLEVGVHTGASLNMWRDYFFKAKNIIGLDITDKHLSSKYESEWRGEIDLIVGDSTRQQILDQPLLKDHKFDIIIDDGDHYYENQINTFENLYNILKPGGIYVVEDVVKAGAWRLRDRGGKILNFQSKSPFEGRLSLDNQLVIFIKNHE